MLKQPNVSTTNIEIQTPHVFFIMGVSGVGKSTIGNLLSETMDIPFFDGDDYHPENNIDKMASGQPLNDADRADWLKALNTLAVDQLAKGGCIIACSALKTSYRETLNEHIENYAKWIFLHGAFDLIAERIKLRSDHFMGPDLLTSQFDILEEPVKALKIDIRLPSDQIIELIKKELMGKSQFGLFGLGVMGKSLARNLANNGFELSLFNRHVDGTEEHVASKFIQDFEELSSAQGFDNIEQFVHSLQTPRKIMLMVNAGNIVDTVIEEILPYLSGGDILIDGGNSNYTKTKERSDYLLSKQINWIGTGVSGGEEGALRGPSIMPGGDKVAYKEVRPFLEAISAKDKNDMPCCTYIGPEGSGHFVKMIHNGIEYGEMQLLAEVFIILKSLGNTPDQVADILESWKATSDSYLMDITIDILRKKDGDDWLVNKVLDKAGNKGTGNWATVAAAQYGLPSTMISTSLFARYISFFKDERLAASALFKAQDSATLNVSTKDLSAAYQFARIINHYQGFKFMSEVSERKQWELHLSEIARIWTNGCIIRSDFMQDLIHTFKETSNLLTDEHVVQQINTLRPAARKVVSDCVLHDIAIPCLSESVTFFNSLTTENSSANLIQAQRDYFGAHTYQRKDDESGKYYHSKWN